MMFSLPLLTGGKILYENPEGLYPVNAHQSALLARAAMEQAYGLAAQKRELSLREALASLSAIELCVGNGPAAVALKTIGVGDVRASDINPKALEATRANAALNNLQLDGLRQDDITNPDFVNHCGPIFDLLVCNPPCAPLETVEHVTNENVKKAANAGLGGIDVLVRLIKIAPRLLKPDGRMVLMFTSGLDIANVVNALDSSFPSRWFTSPGTPIAAPFPPTPGNEQIEHENRGKKLLNNEKMLVWNSDDTIFRLTWAIVACNNAQETLQDLALNERLRLAPYGWPATAHPKPFVEAQARLISHLAVTCGL